MSSPRKVPSKWFIPTEIMNVSLQKLSFQTHSYTPQGKLVFYQSEFFVQSPNLELQFEEETF